MRKVLTRSPKDGVDGHGRVDLSDLAIVTVLTVQPLMLSLSFGPLGDATHGEMPG